MNEAGKKLPVKRGARKPAAVLPPVIAPASTAIAAVQAAVAQPFEVTTPIVETAPTPAASTPSAPAPAAAEPASEAPAPTAAFDETIDPIEAASPAVTSDPIPAETLAPLPGGTPTMATVLPNMNETAAATTEKLQSVFGDVGARFKASFEKSSKLGEEMVELTKGNVEAVVASARVAAKGGEALGQDVADYGKKSFESAVAAMKNFASVKSPTELFQLQSEFAKASFDSAVAEASRFSESMMKLAGDVAQPLSTRYAVAAEKIKSATL